ncbi:MAG: hypothetical protein KF803_08115 [Cyclobacteriaceae bacterium]|nr:hypothetical protein [Cyclobacteriaceae bacterium]
MKNLENIPKKNIFDVPDGYFEKLPSRIQARIGAENPQAETKPYFRYALQYALPVVLVVVAAIFIFKPKSNSVEEMLASVSTEQLVAYLDEVDMNTLSTEELIESFEFDTETIEAIEQEVYFNFDLENDDFTNLYIQEF